MVAKAFVIPVVWALALVCTWNVSSALEADDECSANSDEQCALQLHIAARDPVAPANSVDKLEALIAGDGVVRMFVEKMLEEQVYPNSNKQPITVHTVPEMLAFMRNQLVEAPYYPSCCPMSNLFLPMMTTEAGFNAFTNEKFNKAVTYFLLQWAAFLDSADSLYVVNETTGWLSEPSIKENKLYDYVNFKESRNEKHWGYTSWNDFFHRQIDLSLRPITDPDNSKVIVSPNDGKVFNIASNVSRFAKFWIKSQPYSLQNLLDDVPDMEKYVGGDVYQTFLRTLDYHRFHAPISGTITDVKKVRGLTFSNLRFEEDRGGSSQAYQGHVDSRALVFIESDDPAIGTVIYIPIGMTEISSVYIAVKKGDKVKKGDQIGYFNYGGSSVCLVFQEGVIKEWQVKAAPLQPDGLRNLGVGPDMKARTTILAIAN